MSANETQAPLSASEIGALRETAVAALDEWITAALRAGTSPMMIAVDLQSILVTIGDR